MWICKKCNEQNSDNYNFCNKCGKPRPKDKPIGKGWVCAKCKSENWNNDQCCRACGSPKKTTPGPFHNKKMLLFGITAVLLIFVTILMMPKNSSEPWSFNAKTGTLTIRGEGQMQHVAPSDRGPTPQWDEYDDEIRNVIISEGITSIAPRAFWGCSNLTSITLPEGIRSIGEYAFHGCNSLGEIVLPDSLELIWNGCFSECSSLEEIIIPNTVTSLGERTFYGNTNLQHVTLSDNLKYIRSGAFAGCSSLAEISIPASVIGIGTYAFSDCDSLKDIYYEGIQEQWEAIDIGYEAIPDDVTIHFEG